MSQYHAQMESLIRTLDSQASNHPLDSVANSCQHLYGRAADSLRQSRQAHQRADYQTAVSMMHHAAEQAAAAAKLHGAGSDVGSLKAIAANYAQDVNG